MDYVYLKDLLRIPELAINPLGDRIIHAFFFDNEDDKLEFKAFNQGSRSNCFISSHSGLCQRPLLLSSSEQKKLEEPEEHKEGQAHVLLPNV